jgi:S-disulfanyl-L-cysteine oxidoreductase SoxD
VSPGRIAAAAALVCVAVAALSAQRGAKPSPRAGDPPPFDLGQPPPPDLVAAWDTDVMPDGTGLPPGSGTVKAGAEVYQARCAACHGAKGEGAQFDRLVGTASRTEFAFARDPALPRTIGNYWPYATTLFDYVRRAMPPPTPGVLTAPETYAVTAYLLYLNGLLPEDAELNQQTLPRVVMPARDRFVRDDRTGGRVVRAP